MMSSNQRQNFRKRSKCIYTQGGVFGQGWNCSYNRLNMNISILWASPVLNFYFTTARSRIVALYCSTLWATFLLLSFLRSSIKSTSLESTLQSLSKSTYKQGAICFQSVTVSMWKVSNALPYCTIVSQRVATRFSSFYLSRQLLRITAHESGFTRIESARTMFWWNTRNETHAPNLSRQRLRALTHICYI